MTRALAAVVFVLLAAPAPAADPPAPRPPGEAPDLLEPPPAEFYDPKDNELWLQILTRTDWYDGPHVSFGGAAEALFVWDPEMRVRTGPYFALLAGSWGDGERGHVSPEIGLLHRASVYMDELFDVHVVGRMGGLVGFIEDEVSDRAEFGLRGGVGLGFRVARFAMMELTYDRVWVFGEPFTNDDGSEPSHHTGGITFGGGIDLCMFVGCKAEPPEPEPLDATEDLYAEAAAACRTPEEHCRLCAAVDEAMDAHRYHPRGDQDAIEAFLLGVKSQLDGALARRVTQLTAHHVRLREARDENKRWARWAAQSERRLARPLSYAPVAVELRRAFGCDGRRCPP